MKTLNILKYAKFQALICAFAGIIGGVLYATIGTYIDLTGVNGFNYGTVLAYIAIPVMPLYFATLGFLFALVGGFLLNKFNYLLKFNEFNFELKTDNDSKIHILKYAKFQALICSFIGLGFGIFYFFGGLIVDTLVTLELSDPIIWDNTPGLSYGTLLAFMALFLMPLYTAAVGFLSAIVGAFLFNKLKHPFRNMDLNFEKTKNND